jgi:hypothetical protein
MKKYILLFIAFLGLVSCKDYLEEIPKTQISIESSFETYDLAIKQVSALYATIGQTNGLITSERFMMPSIIKHGNEESKKFNWNSSSAPITKLWKNYNYYIAQCNIVIEALTQNSSKIDKTFKNSAIETVALKNYTLKLPDFSATEMLLGEARFLRAYAYFTLYRYFGGVPLIIEPTGATPAYVPRSDRESIFKFIDEELNYAISKCLLNTSPLPLGRITKGAAAGMLAKSNVFHASYISRAEKYGSQIDEDKTGDKTGLYTKAAKLCDDIIAGAYGNYQLVSYYPAIFTKPNQETMFTCYAQEGVGTGSLIPIGFPGNSAHGATNGPNLEQALAVLYDLPTWNYGSRLKTLYKSYGQSDVLRNDISPYPSDSLTRLMVKKGTGSFTGDSIRRLWNTSRAWVSGPKDGLVNGTWVFDPIYGKSLGSGFFIEPGKGNNYTNDENQIIEKLLEPHERLWWRNLTAKDFSCWNVNWEVLGKFRNPNPQNLSATFSATYGGVAYPILRLAEIYLLKAETQLFSGNKSEALKTLNIIRNRACNQSTLRNMFLKQGDSPYSYVQNSVAPIPTNLSDYQTLKELLYERLRELCSEDDCEWLDASRYPDVFIEDIDDVSRYSDPIRGANSFIDPHQGYYGWLGFNANKIFRVLLPIPVTEFTFFPEMKQNPGY